MANPAICFDCQAGGLTRRLRRFLKMIPGRKKGRHCENCGHHLEVPVEAWIRERDAARDASARNSDGNPIQNRPLRPGE